jgi:predicted transcriptional regulator
MAGWTFITNHGTVLILISRKDMITTREIANELNITERSVIRIINELETDGYISKKRVGRSNHYKVNHNAMLRQETVRDIAVGNLLETLSSG